MHDYNAWLAVRCSLSDVAIVVVQSLFQLQRKTRLETYRLVKFALLLEAEC